jgi:uncharacterized membrane protein
MALYSENTPIVGSARLSRKGSLMLSQPPRRIAAALVAVGCAGLAAASAAAQCHYEVSAIIAPEENCSPLPSSIVFGRGMNAHGDVAGYYRPCAIGDERAFFWSESTGFLTLPTPPGVVQAYANDVNDSRMIVGSHLINGVGWTGYVYDPKTRVFTYLQPLHDGHGQTQTVSTVNAINNAGVAVGARLISKPGVTPAVTNAVIWDTNTGEVIDLGVGEGPNSVAVDETDHNDAGGWSGGPFLFSPATRALLWIGDEEVQLEILPGMIQNSVGAVNNQLDAVGTSGDGTPGGSSHFYWLDGVMAEFLPPEGYDRVTASDINDSRQIVGSMRVEGTSTFHPHLWQHGAFHDLRTLIVDAPPNLTISGASEVLNNGLIRAGGTLGSSVVVVLTPTGQPMGDLNYDCRVDLHDLLILLDAWGPVPRANRRQAGPSADLNGDGVVDVSDLLILLANWSQ